MNRWREYFSEILNVENEETQKIKYYTADDYAEVPSCEETVQITVEEF